MVMMPPPLAAAIIGRKPDSRRWRGGQPRHLPVAAGLVADACAGDAPGTGKAKRWCWFAGVTKGLTSG
jgi:hypothetical protein